MKNLLYILLFVPLALFGQGNYSLSFDDVDDYVIIDNPIYSVEEFSLNCWVKFYQSGPNENGNLIGNWSMHPGGAYLLFYSTYQGNQTISAIVSGGEESVHLETPLQSGDFNTWSFISLTYDGTHSKLYINGDLRDSLYGEFGTIEGSNIATFGVEENYNFGQGINAHYGGLMDEISIWNKSLSNQEIQSYMSCPPTGHEESLVGYWKVNEISSNIIYDVSVNENHGIIYGGATLSEDVPEQNCTYFEEFSNLNQIDGFSYGGFYEGSYYFVSQELASWEEANAICNSSGGYLASITSEEENDFISSLLNVELEDGWIGLTDSLIEGDWVWSNGELYEYNNWANNEPGGTDGSSDENHGLIHIGGTWNDGYELTYHQYIMEIDAIYGCLNPDYYNYNPQANTSDESCISVEQHIIDSLEQEINVIENQIDSIQEVKNIYSFEPGIKTAIFYDINSSSDVVDQFIYYFGNHTETVENIALITNQKGQFYWPDFNFTNMDALSYGDIIFVETKTHASYLSDFSFVDISDVEYYTQMDNQISNEYMDEEFLNSFALLTPNFQNNLITDSSLTNEGCMNPWADNYDDLATIDNGTCVFSDTYIEPYNFSQNRQYFIFPEHLSYLGSFPFQEGDIFGLLKINERSSNEYLGWNSPVKFEIIGSCFWNEYSNGFSTSSTNFSPSNQDNYQFFMLRDSIFYNVYVEDYHIMTYNENQFVVTDVFLGEPLIDGCTNPNSLNYSPIATNDNGLCEDIISIGCLDPTSINYAGESANPTNINALNFGDPFVQNQTYNLLTGELSNSNIAANFHDESYCQDDIEGCKEPLALNYDPQANINRETDCIWQLNQMILYNIDETDLISDTLFNFGVFENESDSVINSDFLSANILVENDVLNYNNHIVENMASLMTWIDNNFDQNYSPSIIIDLNEGWNMIGYGCPTSIDLVEGLSNHTESILIVKNNNGEAYLPEWSFNGIGDLIPGFGYQIKLSDSIEGFSLCY